jgi:hypothetical protein
MWQEDVTDQQGLSEDDDVEGLVDVNFFEDCDYRHLALRL